MEQKVLVSIRCLVYNHAPYLRQCLDGFVMQKTNFAFEAIVHDDASTDESAAIIREYAAQYPHIIKPIYESENQYSKRDGSISRIMDAAVHPDAKYIAMCEGDDYWIDPLKLQKQVDFLETHPEYGMCYTNFNVLEQKSGRITYSLFTTKPKEYPITYNSPEDFVLKKGYVCPPSWVYRKQCLPSDDERIVSCDGTFVLFTHFLCTTKVYGMIDTTTTYRILSESASHSKNHDKLYARAKNLLNTQYKLIDYYHLSPNLKKVCEINYYRGQLTQFILYNKDEDIRMAKQILKDRKLKDNILFLLYAMPCGRLLLKSFYYIYKNL